MVKLILKGQENWDKIQKRLNGDSGRLPVTIKMMKLMKKNLGKVTWPLKEKRLFWDLATLAWSGSFRIHELCSKKQNQYDIQTTLMWQDLQTGSIQIEGRRLRSVSVHVKSPKVNRVGTGDHIAAMDRYKECNQTGEDSDMPVFRLPSGECFTGAEVNKRLAELMDSVSNTVTGGVVKSHSFRSGACSEMARSGQYSEEQLQAVGRWSSSAYLNYVKLPRTRRALLARGICMID